MVRAAELRGIPLSWWVGRALHRAAHDDLVEVRSILEAAAFADARERKRRERALHERYRKREQLVVTNQPLARIKITCPEPSRRIDPDVQRLRDAHRLPLANGKVEGDA
jgi:hypothetical protein